MKILICCLILLISQIANSQSTYYVTPTGAGSMDGSSWINASDDLQDMINTAMEGDQIWVAQGSYLPTVSFGGATDRDKTFYINKNIQIYGGFSGGESFLNDRNWRGNPTILDGNLGNTAINTDNAYHVVFIDGTTGISIDNSCILDGFIIQNGNADGGLINSSGGGIYVSGNGALCSPVIQNCQFYDNEASQGGAIFNDGQSSGNASPTIDHCTFISNQSVTGGAICNFAWYSGNSSPIISNSEFKMNTVSQWGGAIINSSIGSGVSSPRIVNDIFCQNTAGEGGAIFNDAENSGDASSPEILHCTFYKNTASSGGAIFNLGDEGSSLPVLINSILWNNGDEIQGDTSTLINCLFDDGTEDGMITYPFYLIDGGGNTDQGPTFLDSITGDLRLVSGSNGIDQGTTSGVTLPLVDADGKPRQNNLPDLGAYELHCLTDQSILFVDVDATGSNTGDSWSNAMTDLQSAIDLACTCVGSSYTIWVAAGIYVPSRKWNGTTEEHRTFYIEKDIAIYGGFDGTESTLQERDISSNQTILSGDLGTTNSYHVVVFNGLAGGITQAGIFDGFTIEGGNANGPGGINVIGETPAINNVGGGMLLWAPLPNNQANPTIQSCVFINNTSRSKGGAIYLNGRLGGQCSPTILQCTFENNQAPKGGAIFANGVESGNANPTISGSTFLNNTSGLEGGAIYTWAFNLGHASPRIISSIFSQNQATNAGGAIYNGADIGTSGSIMGTADPQIVNCSFEGNSSSEGSQIYNYGGDVSLDHCILWNHSNAIANNNSGTAASTKIRYSIFDDGSPDHSINFGALGLTDGGNNRDADPLFIDAGMGDLSLQRCSPAINAGDTSGLMLDSLDVLGNIRVIDNKVDLGAVEYQLPLGAIMVSNSNDAGPGSLRQAVLDACPCDTIMFDASTNGDTIQLLAKINITKKLTLVGNDTSNTLLSGLNAVRLFDVVGSDRELNLSNLTLMHGGNENNGGAVFYLNSRGLIQKCLFKYNTCTLSGGAIFFQSQDTLEISHSIFRENETTNQNSGRGGAIYMDNHAAILIIDNSHFKYNIAWEGGAIYKNDGEMFIHKNHFENNTAMKDGGAINYFQGKADLSQNLFYHNTAGFNAGAIYSSAPLYLHRDTLTMNQGLDFDFVRGGGAIFSDSFLYMDSCLIAQNSSVGRGGGVNNFNGRAIMKNTAILQNSAESIGGGIFNDHSMELTNCQIGGNESFTGGGISNHDSITLRNSIIHGNFVNASVGGGLDNVHYAELINTTITGNKAGDGGGFYQSGLDKTLVMINSLIAKNTANGSALDIRLANTQVIDQGNNFIGDTTGASNFFPNSILKGSTANPVNPEFVSDPSLLGLPNLSGNLRLKSISPAINAGNADTTGLQLPQVDLGGDPRLNGNIDIGAYENPFAGCPEQIILNNNLYGPVNGTYSAQQLIKLGDGIEISNMAQVTLNAPEVHMDESSTLVGAQLSILQNGCLE
ncbi:MAG: hypothetical protein KDC53_06310 [Saprospiraceae bacterium]|nr:hypothetical protein [Saprospiraceae bacterium]